MVAEAGVHWEGLTVCCLWMGIVAKPELEPAPRLVCFQVGDERDGERMWLANASVVEKRTSLSRPERDPKGECE